MTKVLLSSTIFLLVLINEVSCQLTIENKSENKIFFAIGYAKASPGPFDLYSQGWWGVEAGQSFDFKSIEYYNAWKSIYIHAFDSKGNKWGSGSKLWVSSDKFEEILTVPWSKPNPGFRVEEFTEINTYGSSEVKVTISPNGKIKGKAYCNSFTELTKLTAPLLDKFLNAGLPSFLARKTDIDGGNNSKFQFEVHRNGKIQVSQGKSTKSSGSMRVDVPIRIIDARVDWYTREFGITVRHHEDIEGTQLTIHSTVDYNLNSEGGVNTIITNDFSWDSKPYFDVFGINISVGGLCEPEINKVLEGMNWQWYSGTQPLIKSFVNGNCIWKEAAQEASIYLDQFSISSEDAQELQNKVRALINSKLNN
ncbi:MAG: DUF4403 family protein [Saprospiraceae bacterium]|nr:DUF4403 family protein [Saprospiraceae bacterium]